VGAHLRPPLPWGARGRLRALAYQADPNLERTDINAATHQAREGVAHRFQVPDDDHAGFAEERGRRDNVKLSGLVGGRVDVGAFEVGVGLVGEGA